jgi:hypothetical protein
VEHKIALDICLTSNVALRVVPILIIIRSESWSQTVSR